MKHYKLFLSIRIFATACAALGWWGILYPEFTMTPDTYKIISEEGNAREEAVQEQKEAAEWDLTDDIFETVLGTERSRIRFRSRLLMNMTAWYEQERGVNEAE